MQRRYRLLAIGLVVVATTGLCVHYGAVYETNWPHPTADELAEDPDAYDGEAALLIGEVVEHTDDRLRIELETSTGETVDVTVRDAEAAVEPGGTVQVYGVLTDGGTVQHADRIVVVNEDAGDQMYKLGVSAFAGFATAGLFLHYWRIDLRNLRFEVRHG